MCGRFVQAASPEEICERFNARQTPQVAELLESVKGTDGRYNLSANQPVLVITLNKDGQRELMPMGWGLVPAAAEDPKIGSRLINARSETVATLPAFRAAFRQRRCLIPATAYYEWRKEGTAKQPFAVQLQNHGQFAFAGVWEEWRSSHAEARVTCSIITTTANDVISGMSARMPVILPPEDEAAWLEPEQHVDLLRAVLQPYPSEELEVYPVGPEVNRLTNDGPSLLKRLEVLEAVA
jgi:putative SOS response-associated peptidase YedK